MLARLFLHNFRLLHLPIHLRILKLPILPQLLPIAIRLSRTALMPPGLIRRFLRRQPSAQAGALVLLHNDLAAVLLVLLEEVGIAVGVVEVGAGGEGGAVGATDGFREAAAVEVVGEAGFEGEAKDAAGLEGEFGIAGLEGEVELLEVAEEGLEGGRQGSVGVGDLHFLVGNGEALPVVIVFNDHIALLGGLQLVLLSLLLLLGRLQPEHPLPTRLTRIQPRFLQRQFQLHLLHLAVFFQTGQSLGQLLHDCLQSGPFLAVAGEHALHQTPQLLLGDALEQLVGGEGGTAGRRALPREQPVDPFVEDQLQTDDAEGPHVSLQSDILPLHDIRGVVPVGSQPMRILTLRFLQVFGDA